MDKPSIAVGCDHAGFEYKERIKEFLQSEGYLIKDFGTHSGESVDYPDFVHPLSLAVEQHEYRFGVLLCGSANGVAMTANKHPGIRAAIVWQDDVASLARRHNDANVICIPARFVSPAEAKKFVLTFLHTPFEGGRHTNRVNKIALTD